ncbi:hypothetical protein [Reichenbachiella versicolor]|uniref:hypothetical protein n=1 Tax=Reichenbachiella versicolor TaxID=1821036 RepID=UPI0013A54A90|nr:hypothetical protein [Reichenbachiella versicolor]
MKNSIFKIALFLLVTIATSCQDDFEDFDPDQQEIEEARSTRIRNSKPADPDGRHR